MRRSSILVLTVLSGFAAAGEAAPAGDARRVPFVLPFSEARARAQESKRLLFLKPIYGGVDARGAADYRCGSW